MESSRNEKRRGTLKTLCSRTCDTPERRTWKVRNDGGFAPQVTGYDGKVQCPDYNDLRNAMEGIELGDGDSWIREFAKVNPAVTLRILEARKAVPRGVRLRHVGVVR